MNNLPTAKTIEDVLITGDLSGLTPEQKVSYCTKVCESLGLNPLTNPFEYIYFKKSGVLKLYAKKDCTEQLRKIHGVSIVSIQTERSDGLYVAKATAKDKTERTDVATGAVDISNLKGDDLANGVMKAETKAKRRVTLSICGLGILDESEVDTIPNAEVVSVEKAPPPIPPEVLIAHTESLRFYYDFSPCDNGQLTFILDKLVPKYDGSEDREGIWSFDNEIHTLPKLKKLEDYYLGDFLPEIEIIEEDEEIPEWLK